MPRSGNLKELPFPEVLRLVRDHTGTLELVDKITGERFSFRVSAGTLVAASEGGREIPDTLALHSVLQRLSSNQTASFDFEESPKGGELFGPLTIPIDQILLSTLAAIHSPERYALSLPHPDARFRAATETAPWLTGDLLAFWVGTEQLFHSGVSAHEIVAALGLPLPEVLLDLFKLRLLGVIVPVQAQPSASARIRFAPAPSVLELPSAPAPSSPLPPALPAPEPIPPPPAAVPTPPPANLPAVPQRPTAPRRGFLARIAAGLRGILEKMYE